MLMSKNNGRYWQGKKRNNLFKKNLSIKLSGKNNPMYKDIGSIRICHNREYIKISDRKWISYSRYLVNKYIRRTLTKYERVHHIDGNERNNKLSNLYVFKMNGHHSSFETLVRIDLIDRFILKSNLSQLRRDNGKS
jgi:hypothetical protein